MARPRRRSRPGSSLFPFLSVLACVIGTLTLLIAALAIGQVAEDLSRADAAEPELPEALGRSVDELRARIVAAERTRQHREALRATLRARGVDPDAPPAALERAVAALRTDAAAAARLPQLEDEAKRTREAIANARLELERQHEALDDDATIVLQPAGIGALLVPFFVECRAQAVRLHRPDEDWSIPLDIEAPDDRARFDRFLARVRETSDATIILLVRPDGVATYERVNRLLVRRGIRHGKLPVPGTGAIDFRLVSGASS